MKQLVILFILATLSANTAELLKENRQLEEENRALEARWAEQANNNSRLQRERKNYEQLIAQQKAIIAQTPGRAASPAGGVTSSVSTRKTAAKAIPLPVPGAARKHFASVTGGVLTVESPEIAAKDHPIVLIYLDMDEYAGRKVKFSAEVRAESISEPPAHHLGGKFGLRLAGPDGKVTWPAARIGGGSFDWKPVSFECEIPHGAKNAALMLGLQSVSGKISFRNLSVELSE